MAKRIQAEVGEPDLFAGVGNTRRRALILPRLLASEADAVLLRGARQDRAHEIVKKWAGMEKKGQLKRKETALDAGFLHDLFSDALGYPDVTDNPESYSLERNFAVPGIGTADGALGFFGTAATAMPVVVMELKGAEVDLDRDKSNGRTAVQQCWDYLKFLPDCPWGIVSNFVTFRLYHRDKTPLAYQEFHLKDLIKDEVFRQFYCLFERGSFLTDSTGRQPRALKLLELTGNRQREIGDKLYESYSDHRFQLIEHLHKERGKSLDLSIHIAQKILDRIIFIAFCEQRDLLPPKCLEDAWSKLPPFSKVTNPRWRNFLDLFHGIDKGHGNLGLEHGYNGGLFRHDPEVDDLELDDKWTTFFKGIASYDFRDEINVDVLGHIFEKSVGELEKLRGGGFFESVNGGAEPTMPKSPDRKRFGIYYTPPEFTGFIVEQTIGAVVQQKLEEVRRRNNLKKDALSSDKPKSDLIPFWQECLAALRQIKICDPACGSGAFLIRAYDFLEEQYQDVVRNIEFNSPEDARTIEHDIPDMILSDNLHGVDLNEQAVEITQLALWLRTARTGRTLADLSRNIVWGNSLVTDPAVHLKAMRWDNAFPTVFGRAERGFDCVVGNPPWERLKLQEREFFAFSAPAIAGAVSAAKRRKMIADLEKKNPELYTRYTQAAEMADRTLTHVRQSAEFPLTAVGDINTYMLFAELARKIVAPIGQVGLLVPSGIATDNTTREFFAVLIESKSLISLYDYENKEPIFPDVHRSFKFCTLVFGGSQITTEKPTFAFFLRRMGEQNEKDRRIPLSSKDITLLNPNTRTCPIFRTRRDAELTKAVYERVPILIDRSRQDGGNPWGIKFVTMFHQTNDAELFRSPDELKKKGFHLQGNRWLKQKQTFLPLYEAKMIQAYDHRAASVVIKEGNWVRQGQTDDMTLVAHQNPEFVAQPRWWVDEKQVLDSLKSETKPGFVGFKDITSPTNQRTMIAAAIPWSAVTNHFPFILTQMTARQEMCLMGNLNALVLDYFTRQKIGGVTLNFFIVEQLPIFPPDRYGEKCPWNKRQSLEIWISDRVLKLTCTANDMKPLAEAAGFDPPVHKWNPTERAQLTAELDAGYFILYGIERTDVEYILGTFQGLKEDSASLLPGVTPQSHLILEAYDRLCS